jgi:hypothetical protein
MLEMNTNQEKQEELLQVKNIRAKAGACLLLPRRAEAATATTVTCMTTPSNRSEGPVSEAAFDDPLDLSNR